ncbi:MAG: F0F1 ATP synthase subunit gamma, partial [Megasphaera micronuciformis]|nr:F0F1 ATP synthase subunit gamma [Megasphaera micronuciformis]
MPSAREINRRIKSVTNTQQITKAMKMVSSVRLRRAQDRALATAPFTDKIEAMLRRLAAAASGEAGPLFEQREVKRTCYIVVGADKGLAGAFSSNINKAMAAIVAEKGRDAVTFLVTGRKPVEYLKRLRITPAGKWSGFSDKPQYHHAQTVMHEAVKRF